MKNKNEEFKDELSIQYSLLINAERKEQRKRTLIILIIFSVTLISVLVSTVFSFKAYKNTKGILSENKTDDSTYYQTLGIVYQNGQTLKMDGIYNGYEAPTPIVITLTNEGNHRITYKISIDSISTNLASNSNLFFTVTKNNDTSSPKILPVKEDDLYNELTIEPKETASYIINAYYNGVVPEGEYMYYQGRISITQTNSDSVLLQ